MFNLTLLQTLVHSQFEPLFVSSHLISLFVHELGLRGEDLLMTCVNVLLSLLFLEIVYTALDLVSLLIVLLLCQVCLDLLKIEQLGRCLECIGFLLESAPVVLQFFGMTFIHGIQLILISLAQIKQLLVPVGVEFLILFDMRLLAFLTLLLMSERHLLHLALEVLLLELSDAVLGHLCLNVASLSLALDAELFSIFDELCDVFSVHLLILAGLGRVS